jgi:hypothetical protein
MLRVSNPWCITSEGQPKRMVPRNGTKKGRFAAQVRQFRARFVRSAGTALGKVITHLVLKTALYWKRQGAGENACTARLRRLCCAVMREYDATLAFGDVGNLAVAEVVALPGIGAGHAQHLRLPTEMGVGDDTDHTQRPLAHARQRRGIHQAQYFTGPTTRAPPDSAGRTRWCRPPVR